VGTILLGMMPGGSEILPFKLPLSLPEEASTTATIPVTWVRHKEAITSAIALAVGRGADRVQQTVLTRDKIDLGQDNTDQGQGLILDHLQETIVGQEKQEEVETMVPWEVVIIINIIISHLHITNIITHPLITIHPTIIPHTTSQPLCPQNQ
jgi:hypothetical protein